MVRCLLPPPPLNVCKTDKQSSVAVEPMNSELRNDISNAQASAFGTESTHQGGTPLAAATTSAVPGRTTANAHPSLPTPQRPSNPEASE